MILSVATKTTLGSHCVLKILRKLTRKSVNLFFIRFILNNLNKILNDFECCYQSSLGSHCVLNILRKLTRKSVNLFFIG